MQLHGHGGAAKVIKAGQLLKEVLDGVVDREAPMLRAVREQDVNLAQLDASVLRSCMMSVPACTENRLELKNPGGAVNR